MQLAVPPVSSQLCQVRHWLRDQLDVDVRDEPFGVRENVLQGLAFAWGKRIYSDGSVDLWAEIARATEDQA